MHHTTTKCVNPVIVANGLCLPQAAATTQHGQTWETSKENYFAVFPCPLAGAVYRGAKSVLLPTRWLTALNMLATAALSSQALLLTSLEVALPMVLMFAARAVLLALRARMLVLGVLQQQVLVGDQLLLVRLAGAVGAKQEQNG